MRRLPLYGMAAGTVFFWGASFPLTKIVMQELGPIAIAFTRWTLSALILWLWLVLGGARKGQSFSETAMPFRLLVRKDLLRLCWIAVTGITIFYYLENTALRYTTVINAGVLSNLTAVFIVLIGTVWLREHLAPIEWIAVMVSFGGALVVSLGAGRFALLGSGLIGDLLMILACVFGAIYSIGGKQLVVTHSPVVVTTAIAAIGALFLLPLALLEGFPAHLSWKAWGMILVLSIGSGALANLWWLQLLSHVDASRAGVALFAIPVVSTILAVAVLGERLTAPIVLGSAGVLLGVAIIQHHAAHPSQ